MKRREFLLESGAAIAAVSMGACITTPRLQSHVVSLRDQMAARVEGRRARRQASVEHRIGAPDAVSRVPGRYGWDGGFGTSWFNDPRRDVVAIVMTQSSDVLFNGAVEAFFRGVYAGVE